MIFLTDRYRKAVALGHRSSPYDRRRGMRCGFALAVFLMFSGVIGSEFLPHLDEGAIWVRGTLAPSTGPTEGIRVANQARVIFASFPEVTSRTSQVGRPDDGTDTTGFFNTEYFVDLKPKEKWRPVFHQDKDDLIAAMNRELNKIPGVLWDFSQPIADNMEEAVSGVKGELAIKMYGDDLQSAGRKGRSDRQCDARRQWHRGPRRVSRARPAEPEFRRRSPASRALRHQRRGRARCHPDRRRWQSATQVLQGEARYDLVLRYLPHYRDTKEAIENIRLLSPSGERVSLAQLARSKSATAPRKSIAKKISATSPSNTACAGATWAAPSKKP